MLEFVMAVCSKCGRRYQLIPDVQGQLLRCLCTEELLVPKKDEPPVGKSEHTRGIGSGGLASQS